MDKSRCSSPARDIGPSLLQLLEDNPDAPPFCLHRALLGADHKCVEHDVVKQRESVPVLHTPVQLRKVSSPWNLELDSDMSGNAGWSLSMATPTVPKHSATKGKSLLISNLLSTTCESTVTEDTSVSVLTDESILGVANGGNEEKALQQTSSSEKDLKIINKVIVKRQSGHKPVVRTLFPRCSNDGVCFECLSPIPHATSPPVLAHQQMLEVAEHESNTNACGSSSNATVSLFETPGKSPGHAVEGKSKDDVLDRVPCSQELFGSPEIFTPRKPLLSSQDHEVVDGSSSSDVIGPMSKMVPGQEDWNKLPESTSCSTHDVRKSLVSRSPLEVNSPGTHLTLASLPLVHSTPLCSLHSQHVDSDSPILSATCLGDCASVQTPTMLSSHVAVPSPLSVIPDTAPVKPSMVPIPAVQGPKFSLGEEDIFDILFMSSSQLELRLHPKNDSVHASAKSSKVNNATKVCTGKSSKVNATGISASQSSMINNATEVSGSHPLKVLTPETMTESEFGLDEGAACGQTSIGDSATCKDSPNTRIRCEAVEENIAAETTDHEPPDGEMLPPRTKKRLTTKAFLYPGNKRLTRSRRKRVRVRETKPAPDSSRLIDKMANEHCSDITPQSPPPKKVCVDAREPVCSSASECSERVSGDENAGTQGVEEQEIKSVDESFSSDSQAVEMNMHTDQTCAPAADMDSHTQQSDPMTTVSNKENNSFESMEVAHENICPETPPTQTATPQSQPLERGMPLSLSPKTLFPETYIQGNEVSVTNTHQEVSCDPVTNTHQVHTVENTDEDKFTSNKLATAPVCKDIDSIQLLVSASTGLSVPPSAVLPVVKQQHRVPGLRRSFGGNLHKRALELSNDSSEDRRGLVKTASEPFQISSCNPSTEGESLEKRFKTGSANRTTFGGFQTASGTSVVISKEALHKAKQLLREELEDSHVPIDTPIDKSARDNQPPQDTHSHDKSIKAANINITDALCASTTFATPSLPSGFKPRVTSSSAFTTPNSRHQYQTPTPVALTTTKTKQKSCSGHRPKGKPFKAPRSASSVTKAEERASVERILRNFRVTGAKSDTTPCLKSTIREEKVEKMFETGFSTAGGSKVTAKHSSIIKAKRLLASDKENGVDSEAMIVNHPVSDKSTDIGTKVTRMEMTGFKTAAGKGLSVSSASLEQAKYLSTTDEQDNLPSTSSLERKPSSIISNSFEGALPSVGFQTASGKGIAVSSEALFRAKSIIEGVGKDIPPEEKCIFDIEPQRHTPLLSSTVLTGFKTAHGSAISVTKKSLEIAQKLDEGDSDVSATAQKTEDAQLPLNKPPLKDVVGCFVAGETSVTGFNTAGGRSITVSRDSLKKAEEFVSGNLEEKTVVAKEQDTTHILPAQELEGIDLNEVNCSLTAKDIESLDCFTQIDFHADPIARPLSLVRANLQPDTTNNLLSEVEPPTGNAESTVVQDGVGHTSSFTDQNLSAMDVDDSRNEYFSTQVVKQFLDFSMDEDDGLGNSMGMESNPEPEGLNPEPEGPNTEPEGPNPEPDGPNLQPEELIPQSEGSLTSPTEERSHRNGSSSEMTVLTPTKDCKDSDSDVSVQSSLQPETPDVGMRLLDSSFVPGQRSPTPPEGPTESQEGTPLEQPTLSQDNTTNHQEERCAPTHCNMVPSSNHEDTVEINIGVHLSDLEATFSSEPPSRLETSNLSAMKDILTKSMVDNMDTSSLACYKELLEHSNPTQHVTSSGQLPDGLPSDDIPTSSSPCYEHVLTEQAETPLLHKDTTSISLEEQAETPPIHKYTTSSSLEEQTATPLLHKDTTSSSLEEQAETPLLHKDTTSSSLEEQAETPLLHKDTTSSSLEEQAETPLLHKDTTSSSLEEQTETPLLHRDTTSSSLEETLKNESLEGSDTCEDSLLAGYDSKSPTLPLVCEEARNGRVCECSSSVVINPVTVDSESSSTQTHLQAVEGPSNDVLPQQPPSVDTPFEDLLAVSGSQSIPDTPPSNANCDSVSSEATAAKKHQMTFGLTTAGGRVVEVSEKALTAVRLKFSTCPPAHTSFPGLQTASGKEVTVSNVLLRAAKAKLGDCCGESSRGNSSYPGLQTAGGKEVKISDQSIQAARATLDGCGNSSGTYELGFPSLKTASGKSVPISERSLQEVRSVLNREDSNLNNTSPGIQNASGNKLEVTKELADRATLETSERGNNINFQGLQTASGRKVEVSEDSLRAVRCKLDTLSASLSETSSRSIFPSLHTASGKDVSVSEQSLQAARATLCTDISHNNSFPGLQTASGKNITISDKSLQAVRATLDSSECISDGIPSSSSPSSTSQIHSHEYTQSAGSQTSEGTASEETVSTGRSSLGEEKNNSSFQPPVLATRSFGQSSRNFETTPTRGDGKYRPVFKPGASMARQDKRGQTHTGHSEGFTHHLGRGGRGCSQGTTHRGLISTPEGTLRDRHPPRPHRPLLPTQTFLNEDGSYSVTQSRNQHLYRTPHRTRNSIPSNPSHRSSKNSVPVALPTSSVNHLHQSTNTLICNATHQKSDSHGSTRQGSSQGGFATPSRPTYQRPVSKRGGGCAPVWKASIGKDSRRAKVPSTAGGRVLQTGRQAHMSCVSAPTHASQQSAQESPEECSLPNAPSPLLKDTTLQSSSMSVCVRTSTQTCDSNDPLSPLHITLSQVCAMEDSQNLDDEEAESCSVKAKTQTVEDSGYVSREVSSTRTPSPDCETAQERKLECGAEDSHARGRGDDENDLMLAEIAVEMLNDSLDGDNVEYGGTERPITYESNTVIPKGNQDSASLVSSNTQPPQSTPTGSEPTTTKPLSGTLLSLRTKYKRISLRSSVCHRPPGGYSLSEIQALGVSSSVLSVSASNASNYNFPGHLFFSSSVLGGASVCVGDGAQLRLKGGVAGVSEFWDAFRKSPGVDERLISYSWFANHYRQLVWKLTSMEVSYPNVFGGRCLTPDWLLLQMKYRYDREIDRAERSAVHKICEHDDLPSRRLILCVSKVFRDRLNQTTLDRGKGVGSATSSDSQVQAQSDKAGRKETAINSDNLPCVELTDGWYSLPCVLDTPLKHMVKSARVTVGTKLMIFGSELVGLSSPCHPLEIPGSCYLKISANSTRRVRWFAKLGYQPTPHSFPVPLTSVYPDGGLVGCTDVVIDRVYPLLYLEKKEGAKNEFRSERQERRISLNFERERQKKIEKICCRVQKEFEDEIAIKECQTGGRRRSRRLNTLQIKQLQDGEEIHTALNNAPDPTAFQELLSRTQIVLLESYHQSLISERQTQLQERIRVAIQEAEEQLPQQRNVIPLLKVRIVPCGGTDGGEVDCILSVWRPAGTVKEVLKEGAVIRVTNLSALPVRTNYQSSRLQLSATRSTVYRTLNSADVDRALAWYRPRVCSSISFVNAPDHLPHGELDIVGVVVCITSSHVMSHDLESGPERQLDSVFLADNESHLLLVKIWDGVEARDLHDVVKPGALLTAVNLTYRGVDHTHNIPTATAGDCTLFSQRPRESYLKEALEQLRQNLPKEESAYLNNLEEEFLLRTCL